MAFNPKAVKLGEVIYTEPALTQAKGRSGYFGVHFILTAPHDATRVGLHFFSNKSDYPGPAWVSLDPGDAMKLAAALYRQAADVRRTVAKARREE